MKYDSHYSLAVLIPMVIWGGTLPVQAADGSMPRRYEDI
ncbi:TonB-dependent receptor [Klebsiella grimontii]|uniref:TonB-dependent receptor n=1 Tax=Klebsiella grimontii TaxID=2058152 RepID=A0A7H4PBY8_9ENTR|nr:TonB-dependent receptor [Klebsiella grimontii]